MAEGVLVIGEVFHEMPVPRCVGLDGGSRREPALTFFATEE